MNASDELDLVRVTISLPTEQASQLQALSDALNITLGGVVYILLDEAYPSDLISSAIDRYIEASTGLLTIPPFLLNKKGKKRPTRANLEALRTQMGVLVPSGVKVDEYKGGNYV
jgi:hypothetical protein